MVMGVKYQIMSCKFPEEIMQVTCTHLKGLSLLIPGAAENSTIKSIEDQLLKKFEKYTNYEFERVRQTLLKFLQGRHVKVSLFIQEGMQNLSGGLIFPKPTCQPPFIKKPGTIEYFLARAKKNRIYDTNGAIANFKTVPLISAEGFIENVSILYHEK